MPCKTPFSHFPHSGKNMNPSVSSGRFIFTALSQNGQLKIHRTLWIAKYMPEIPSSFLSLKKAGRHSERLKDAKGRGADTVQNARSIIRHPAVSGTKNEASRAAGNAYRRRAPGGDFTCCATSGWNRRRTMTRAEPLTREEYSHILPLQSRPEGTENQKESAHLLPGSRSHCQKTDSGNDGERGKNAP